MQIAVLFLFAKKYLTPSTAMVAVACMLAHPRYWLNQHAEANAVLFVGMGEHIVEAVHKNWLRKGIEFRKVDRFSATYQENETNRRPIYFMVIPRSEHYNDLARAVPESAKPLYEVRVDGGLVFRIVRLDGMFTVR